jgi:hypothetical protein
MIKRRKIRLNGEWQLDGRNQVYELKMATFVRKSFYPKILKWQKVNHQEKKIENVQICQNALTPLRS